MAAAQQMANSEAVAQGVVEAVSDALCGLKLGLLAARAIAGHMHGLGQPIVQLRLVCQGIAAKDVAAPSVLNVDVQLSRSLTGSQTAVEVAQSYQPVLSQLHGALLAIQEAAGWPICKHAVLDRVQISALKGHEGEAEVVLCLPSHRPTILKKVVSLLLPGPDIWRKPRGSTSVLRETVNRLIEQMQKAAPAGVNNRLLMTCAQELGIPVVELPGGVIQYGHGQRGRWMESSFTENASTISARLVRNKVTTNQFLSRAGIPVTTQVVVSGVEQAVSAASEIGYPVVVKPLDLDGGKGVQAGLQNEQILRGAFEQARRFSPNLIVERHIEGKDFRLGVVNGALAWTTYREPAGVWGDGVSSVAQLIEQANQDPRRETTKWAMMVPLVVDQEAEELLLEQGVEMGSVLSSGKFLRLRRAANISSGGTPIDVPDERVHPDNVDLVTRVAKLCRLDIAGIDFICPDVTRSWHEVGGAICEVNGQPQFSVTRPETSKTVLFATVAGSGRIPIVVILGQCTWGLWAQQLDSVMSKRGLRLGFALHDGLYVGNHRVRQQRKSCFEDARSLLLDRGVGAIVVSTDGQAWLGQGMPFDRVDVVVADASCDRRVVRLLFESSGTQLWKTRSPIESVLQSPQGLIDRLEKFMVDRDQQCQQLDPA